MQAENAPPTRRSPLFSVMVKPRGQDHCARCCGSVHTLNTSARGASNVRRIVSSRSAAGAALFRALASMSFLLSLQLAEICIEAFEALLPVAAIALGPFRHLLQRSGPQPAGPGLRLATTNDESGALQHLQVLRDGGLAHVEGLGELHHSRLPGGEAREDRAPRGVRQSGKGLVEVARSHVCIEPLGYITRNLLPPAHPACQGSQRSERSVPSVVSRSLPMASSMRLTAVSSSLPRPSQLPLQTLCSSAACTGTGAGTTAARSRITSTYVQPVRGLPPATSRSYCARNTTRSSSASLVSSSNDAVRTLRLCSVR